MSAPVSDFELMHELAYRLGLYVAVLADTNAPSSNLARAFNDGGAAGLMFALRAEMERERAGGEKVAARAFARAEDSSRLDWLTSGGEEEPR